LRAARRVCRTVVLRLRFDDFSRATRSVTLPEGTAQTREILAAGRGLLAAALSTIEKRGLTLIGIALTNLEDADAIQLVLPFAQPRASALDSAIDILRDRFGPGAITRAVLLGRDPGVSMPLLPD
jgi:DNA polymerase-4